MAKRKIFLFAAYWFGALMLVPGEYAWGYIDPATTTYILQIAAAVVVSLGVSLGVILYRFQMIATRLKVWIHSLTRRIRSRSTYVNNSASTVHTEKNKRKQKADTYLSEAEALDQGIIDYPIPVRSTYPAVANYSFQAGISGEKCSKPSSAGSAGREKKPRNRLSFIWHDERRPWQHLVLAVLLAAALTMTFVVFNILDSVILNQSELAFTFENMLEPVVVLGVQVFLVILLVLAPLRGRIFDFALCLLLALLLCGYLQITFFNVSLGTLIGLPLTWEELGIGNVIGNIAIWASIFLLVFMLGFRKRKRGKSLLNGIAVFVPILIFSVQMVALISVIPSDPSEGFTQIPEKKPEQTLTVKDRYKISNDNNVLVFIVDMLDEEFIKNITAEDADFFASLDGFTQFTNNLTRHNETFPSVVNMLTSMPYDPNIPGDKFLDKAYDHGTFVEDIRQQGYSSNLYIEKGFTYTDTSALIGIADNLESNATFEYEIDKPAVLDSLVKLAVLKTVPLACKDRFFVGPDEFMPRYKPLEKGKYAPYAADDIEYYRGLRNERLNVVDEPAHFSLVHLNGSHYPWHMNAQARYVKDTTTGEEQTKGCFLILKEYLRQMKALGVYESATIIITGDHPTHTSKSPLQKAMLTGLFVKPAGEANTPLRYSNAPVTIDNLGATCVEAAGADSSKWGQTYFEVKNTNNVQRDYYNRYTDQKTGEGKIAHYVVRGDANNWSNWTLKETIKYDPANKQY